MVTQLEPACYMAREQACYTFQPQVSQLRLKKEKKRKEEKSKAAFPHSLAVDLTAAAAQRIRVNTSHTSTVEC